MFWSWVRSSTGVIEVVVVGEGLRRAKEETHRSGYEERG